MGCKHMYVCGYNNNKSIFYQNYSIPSFKEEFYLFPLLKVFVLVLPMVELFNNFITLLLNSRERLFCQNISASMDTGAHTMRYVCTIIFPEKKNISFFYARGRLKSYGIFGDSTSFFVRTHSKFFRRKDNTSRECVKSLYVKVRFVSGLSSDNRMQCTSNVYT